jgi:glycosyltransferase involved in cell wall biosynthesis
VFLSPSALDAGGTAVLEAQAAGLPVLVTDRGAGHEYIAPDETGYMCPAGNADVFAHRLSHLFWHPDRRTAMGNAARAYSLMQPWDRAVGSPCRVYGDVLRNTTAGSPSRLFGRREPADASPEATLRAYH